MSLDNNFDSGLLEKIKEQNLQPTPVWHFLLKNYVMWGLGFLSLSFGAISVSLILFLSQIDDLSLTIANSQDLEDILLIFPIFWIMCSVIFIFAVFYNIKHTKRGYRYSPLTLSGVIIISSFVLGFAINAAGFGETIDQQFSHHAPLYDRLINPRINFWSQPDKGRLSGMIVEKKGSSTFRLIDKNNHIWIVEVGDVLVGDAVDVVEVNTPIHFFGSIADNDSFRAKKVMPPMHGDGFFYRFQVKQTAGVANQ